MKTPKEYLAAIGAKGGKKSRRKLTKKEARRIAMVRWAAGAGRGAVKASKQSGAGSQNDQDHLPPGSGGGAQQKERNEQRL
jgi:hypothetical protein